MNDLVQRLRGQYKVGVDGAFGTRSFSDFIPPISLEAANEIERIGSEIKALRNALKQCQEALEIAENGIKWYIDNTSEGNNCDHDALVEIQAAQDVAENILKGES